ncbi:hypothetical protein QJU89_03690 [Pasteurella skyensis]|uniref:Uncharacterized protein n=1 Tax=Phocoenobacter skyensis TaxID=97481 RepID=A0AAJ6NZY0_9PAST|nr:hypothetical protein [Pasteurella skyensis]MDP8161938.1 hypothetical protein [Pasteurella skyensis]MDP8170285.1 hypothetical protein [Pasteurella skyensis]MDP8172094.1 hypothetical protein [Pasteurella skyensis]MDP8176558.1 hypothetical protein [Pasteurella skyensis]MDP8178446.1 hypothetical protein [Pasteurella skyensis]
MSEKANGDFIFIAYSLHKTILDSVDVLNKKYSQTATQVKRPDSLRVESDESLYVDNLNDLKNDVNIF